MRFRKSVNICKGVKLNLSKSGASLTVGPGKGVSLNLGTKGAFVNWSIPGTGVYDRVRVDTLIKDKLGGLLGGRDEEREDEKAEETREAGGFDGLGGLGGALGGIGSLLGLGGTEEEETERTRKKAKSGTTAQKTASAKKSSARKTTARKTTGTKKPSGPSRAELERLNEEMALINIHLLSPQVSTRATGKFDAEAAEKEIEDWLSEAEAPIAFSVQTQALEDKATVMIDLDLPEIEDMPSDKLTELADGTLKIKKKSQKEAREDYKKCVFGLGEYVAGNAFDLVPAAKKVVVSAYTQRRDEKTGEQEDTFIYSVIFERAAFRKGYEEADPFEFCAGFESRFYPLSSGLLKKIEPYEAEDL